MKNKNIARAGIALAAAAAMTLPIAPMASADGPTVTHLSQQSTSEPGDAVMAGWESELTAGQTLELILADKYLTDDGYDRGELTTVSDDDENLKAKFDESSRTVTITAEDDAVGKKVTISVTYTKDAVPGDEGEPAAEAKTFSISHTVTVVEKMSVIHEDLAYVTGGTYRANVPGDKSLNKDDYPEGTTFELAAGDKDKGITVDKVTGKLTLVFDTEQADSTVDAVVVATFPDKSEKKITASIPVAELLSITHDETTAYYDGKVVQGYGSQVIAVPVHDLPEGTTFKIEEGDVPEGAKISVDRLTGGIRVLSGTTRDQDFAVTVNAVFVDGSTRPLNATVRYNTALAERHKPSYSADKKVKDGVETDFPAIFGSKTIPGEVKIGDVKVESVLDFDIIEADGGEVEVEEGRSSLIYNPTTGGIDILVPFGTPEGTSIRVVVPFEFPEDGSTATGIIETEVVQNDAAAYDPVYKDTGAVDAMTGAAAKTVHLTGSELPDDTTFTLDDAPAEWNVSLDEATGAITFTTPAGAAVGDVVTVTVTVNYPDGTSEKVTQTIEVMDSFAEATAPEYLNTWIKPGETKVIVNTGEEFPEGVTVTADQSTVTDGWAVDVDDEHAIHVTAPKDAEIGDELTFDVNIRYKDQSGETQNVTVTVSLYDPDLIQRTIRRTIVIEVPPTQDAIDAAVQERDEQIAAEEDANDGAVEAILANTGASVGTLALAATIAAAMAGAGFYANRRRNS